VRWGVDVVGSSSEVDPMRLFPLLLMLGCSEYEINASEKPGPGPVDSAAPPVDTAPPADTAPPVDTSPPVDTAPVESACDCPEGFTALPDDDGCVRRTEVEPTFLGEGYAVCPVLPHPDYGSYGARYPGGTTVSDDYWGENDGVPDGRLNATGVWACGADGVSSGYDPVNEWIGFSVCVNIDTAGDYLLGLGADNRMRLRVDGVTLLDNTDDNVDNFKYWWMQAISLSSGPHIVEFEGFNAGGPAGLGAEISGPFASGSLTDDASMASQDYAGNLVWTAQEAIGASFALGETSGYQCPDGMALDLCAEAPNTSASPRP
jgi:hypothetical protein